MRVFFKENRTFSFASYFFQFFQKLILFISYPKDKLMNLQSFYPLVPCSALVLLAYLFATRLGFYQINQPYFKYSSEFTLREVLEIMGIFLGIELILIPLLFLSYLAFEPASLASSYPLHFKTLLHTQFSLLAIVLSFIGISRYLYLQPASLQQTLIWGEVQDKNSAQVSKTKRAIKDFLIGCSLWLISYPIVLLVSQIVTLIMVTYTGSSYHPEQAVVQQMRALRAYPYLFFSLAGGIVFLVPIVEEIIFRGFLQRWLVRSLGMHKGLVLTSLIFAFFHLSWSQGWSNGELVVSLFILSCFLGYSYERQGSIFAPLGLHMTFNFMTILYLIIGAANE